MIKESVHQKDYNNLKCLCTTYRTVSYVKQKLIELKGEIDKSKIVTGDFISY